MYHHPEQCHLKLQLNIQGYQYIISKYNTEKKREQHYLLNSVKDYAEKDDSATSSHRVHNVADMQVAAHFTIRKQNVCNDKQSYRHSSVSKSQVIAV